MKNTIAKSILMDIFQEGMDCGPNFDHKQYFKYVNKSYSQFVNGSYAPRLLPRETYNPDIKVVIDFTHQFVLNTDDQQKIFLPGWGKPTQYTGKRIVSKDNLKHFATELIKFFSYYFDYVLSYGKSNNLQYLLNRINNMNSEEDDILPFINNIMNYFLTNVTIERSRDAIGSCTITLRDNPNYKNGEKYNIFLNKTQNILNQLFVPMLPVMVWAKGRLYKDWYFPIFDGYIVFTSPANSGGFTTLTMTCKDSLELAKISQEMVNPSIIIIEEFRKQQTLNIFSKPFYGLDHMTIFNTMFHGGNVVYSKSGGKILNTDDTDKIKKINKLDHDRGDYLNFTSLGNYGYAMQDARMTPDKLSESKVIHKDDLTTKEMIRRVSHTRRPRYTSYWGEKITPYRIFDFQSWKPYTSDFSSRLDVLRQSAGLVYYELYVDGYGTIQSHPMRLANDYLIWDTIYDVGGEESKHRNIFPGSQVVGPEETTDVSTNLNVDELVTFLRLVGHHEVIKSDVVNKTQLVGSAIDRRFMERYGYRRKEINNPLFGYNTNIRDFDGSNIPFMNLAARSFIKFMNAELYTRTATLIFRPEMEIASPVIFTDDNNVFYVRSLSHSITIGGSASTIINCNYGRQDGELPPDLANYMLISEKMFKTSGVYTPAIGELIGDSRKRYVEQEKDKYAVMSNEMWADIEKKEAQLEQLSVKKHNKKSKKKKERNKKGADDRSKTKDARDATELQKSVESLAKLFG